VFASKAGPAMAFGNGLSIIGAVTIPPLSGFEYLGLTIRFTNNLPGSYSSSSVTSSPIFLQRLTSSAG
jgi:hypothetical protein